MRSWLHVVPRKPRYDSRPRDVRVAQDENRNVPKCVREAVGVAKRPSTPGKTGDEALELINAYAISGMSTNRHERACD